MSDGLSIALVNNPLLWASWPEAEAMLEPAIALSDDTLASVKKDLASGDLRLVSIEEGGDLTAAALVRTIQGREGHVFEIAYCGGLNFRNWATDLAEAMETFARNIGCVSIRIWGRPGWKAIFEPLNWKTPMWCFEKAFAHG